MPGGPQFPHRYETKTLAALTRRIIQPSEFIREYVDTSDNAVPLLRAANTTDGEIDLADFVYVDRSKLGGAGDSFIQEGDILVTRTGANAGATSRVPALPREYIVSSHSLRLLPNTDEVDNRYLEAFLLSRWGKAQLVRSMTGAAQKQLQIAGISPILIARPPREVQQRLVAALDTARAARRRKLEEAESLLGGLDAFVLETLGLTLPPPDGHRTTYAVRLSDVREGKKLYPDYFHPERLNAIRAIAAEFGSDYSFSLARLADFRRDQRQVRPDDPYLGLANVQPNTGVRIDSTEEDGEGTVFEYAENDVLFARLRPYLNKVYRAESGGVCSPEFHVMRVRIGHDGKPLVLSDYLAAVLRSAVVLAQTRHMMTGNTHPRLANDDVVNLVIPVPNPATQKKIAAEVYRRRDAARRLREEAAQLWDNAKRRFEEALLGPAVPETKGGR